MFAGAESGVVLGEGDFTYNVFQNWGRLPEGWSLVEVAAVAVAQNDDVYVFNRGDHPMIVFDRNGNFLRSWGEGLFTHAHGLHIGPDDAIYCTDNGDHTVRKMSSNGRVLMQIGITGKSQNFMSGLPFHQCTHTALSPTGEVYVSDGYGNARVHKFTPDGRLLKSWGTAGSSPGQFNLPHNICCDEDGWVYVADRENHRIQVFDKDGRFETQWNNLHRPSGLFMTGGQCPLCYIGELGPYLPVNRDYPNLGPRVSILDKTGKVLARLGHTKKAKGRMPGQFTSPHGIAVDSHGDIYVGEVAATAWQSLFPGRPHPENLCCLQKLVKVHLPSGVGPQSNLFAEENCRSDNG